LGLNPRHKAQLADEDHVWILHSDPGILPSLRIFPSLFCNICSKSIRGFTDSVLHCQSCGSYAHGQCVRKLGRKLKGRHEVPPCKALCRQDIISYAATTRAVAEAYRLLSPSHHGEEGWGMTDGEEEEATEEEILRRIQEHAALAESVERGQESASDDILDSDSAKMPHQWLHGNLDILQNCNACGQYVGSDGMYALRGWRCMWCECQVHEACWADPEVRGAKCDLGRHRRLLLPPTCLKRNPRMHRFRRWKPEQYGFLDDLQIEEHTDHHSDGWENELQWHSKMKNLDAQESKAKSTDHSSLSQLVSQIGASWFAPHSDNSTHIEGDDTRREDSDWEDEDFNDSTNIENPSNTSSTTGNEISVQQAKFAKRIKKVVKRGQKLERYLHRYELLTNLVPEDTHPLLVLVNSKSGGQQGQQVLRGFKGLLHPFQVWDVTDIGPAAVLRFFKDLPRLKVLVAGGDGTVGWILQEVEQVFAGSTRVPPVAILPLGTGNDLARMLKWGGGYTGGDLNDVLQGVANAHPVEVDRWNVNVTRAGGKEGRSLVMNNYLGVGIDGALSLDFHEKRKANPNMFINRFLNKVMYGGLGFQRFLIDHSLLADKADVYCDGKKIEFPPGTQGVICLNINSYAGGSKLWDEKNPEFGKSSGSRSSLKDELVEVVAVQGLHHLGAIQVGLVPHATSIAQCHSLSIEIKNGSIPVQVDGEPWRQDPCTINVRHRNQAILLEKTVDIDGEWLGRFEQIMLWAERESLVPAKQTNAILREAIKRWSHL